MSKTVSQTTSVVKGRVKNRILSITRNTIPYVKELRRLASVKSVTACVLMQQLDYWFEKYPDGFWKFLEPCIGHSAYRPGKSWKEELGMSADEFRTAFEQLGVRYKSKKEFDAAADKFEGKYYCSYTDKVARLTHYFRNHEVVDADLDSLVQMDNSQMENPQMEESHSYISATPIPTTGQSPSPQMGNSNPDYKEINKDTTQENTQERESNPHSQVTHSSSLSSTANDAGNSIEVSTAIDAEKEHVIEAEPVFDSKPITPPNFVPATGQAVVLPEPFPNHGRNAGVGQDNTQAGVDIDRATEKFRVYYRARYDKDWLGKWQLLDDE